MLASQADREFLSFRFARFWPVSVLPTARNLQDPISYFGVLQPICQFESPELPEIGWFRLRREASTRGPPVRHGLPEPKPRAFRPAPSTRSQGPVQPGLAQTH